MRTYEFMNREALKKIDIPQEVKKKFGVEIDENTFSNSKKMVKDLEKIFRENIKENLQEDWNEVIEENGAEEIKYLKETMARIKKMIYDLSMYQVDLTADIFMGILRADENYNIIFDCDWEEKWDKGAYNLNINMENAKKHYPFVDRCDFKKDGIPGGCEEYHKLMIFQKNMDVFNVADDKDKENLTRYGFPKTYKIYERLKDTLLENMILLEETQGIAYTNHIYHYVKKIMKKETLEKLLEVIQKGLEIRPMFLRNKVIDAIMEYMEFFSFSENSKKLAIEKLEQTIIDDINWIYEWILEFEWYVCWLAYKKNRLYKDFDNIQLYLLENFEKDYNMDEVYEDWIQKMNLHDWRNVKTVDDCFSYINTKPVNPVELMQKGENICIETADGKQESLWIKKPLNLLGEKIQKEAIEEIKKARNLPQNKQEWSKLYAKKKEDIFEKIKKEEEHAWNNQDIMAPGKRLKIFHTYAMIHRTVIRKLIELE